MGSAGLSTDNEWLFQEFIASRIAYRVTVKKIRRMPDSHPEKAEIADKLKLMKQKMSTVEKFFSKNIDTFADLLDPELRNSLNENDIIRLREELYEVRRSIAAMEV